MSSRLTITLGSIFLVLGLAGFIYILARPKPAVVPAPADVLPFENPAPSPTPVSTPEEKTPENSPPPAAPTPSVPHLSVRLVTPVMAQTFVAPAEIKIEATAQPARQLTRIDYYYTPVGFVGHSFCRSLNDLEPTLNPAEVSGHPALVKIGESTVAPHTLFWTTNAPGIYNVIAVGTFRSGLQEMSPPVVIVVNAADTYEGSEWRGWRRLYPENQIAEIDPQLMPAPTPDPACPQIKVYALNPAPPAGSLVTFKADVANGDLQGEAKYAWTVTGGSIVGGGDTSTITVSTRGSLDEAVKVTVEAGPFGQSCPSTSTLSVPLTPPEWLTPSSRGFLRQKLFRLAPLRWGLVDDPTAQGYLLVFGERDSCVSRERIEQSELLKKYLVELDGLPSNRITLLQVAPPADNAEQLTWETEVVSPGKEVPEIIQTAKAPVACRVSFNFVSLPLPANAPPVNRKCPDLVQDIDFTTSIPHEEPINICPYNSRDPRNDKTVLGIRTGDVIGRVGNFPKIKFWVNGGEISENDRDALWDLSPVKLRAGVYTLIAETDGGCDCASLAATQVNVTSFCTPCLTGRRVCSVPEAATGTQVFRVAAADFARADDPAYDWETSQGTIVNGQSTSMVTVDTSKLATGTKFVVRANVRGMQRYCVNRLSFQTAAGADCIDPKHHEAFPLMDIPGESSVAKRRRSQSPNPPSTDEIGEGAEPEDTTPTGRPTEHESIKVTWSPKVKTDDSFSIVVNYNRSQESVQVSNQVGEITEQLKLSSAFKLLKEKYGPHYRVLANVRFDSAGLDLSNCHEQYQSLDNENVEWSCNVSPRRAGSQTFNLELWVKGEPRAAQSGSVIKEPEKVWSKNNLKVEVSAPLVTKTTVFGAASLCVVVGLGFSLRWLKIYRIGDTYNVGQAVAVGRNVHIDNATVTQNAPSKSGQEEKNNG